MKASGMGLTHDRNCQGSKEEAGQASFCHY